MTETQQLIKAITDGIQEKKGKQIVVVDLSNIGDTICQYFIICQGNSPSQVQAIAESVTDFTRKEAQVKPIAVDGLRNAEWVAMDYSNIIVHIFLPVAHDFYDIEHLWEDAQLTRLPDFD
ncbi:MAG: ribosome silencing factor [Paraprevotella sp.]|nr:ribosome silencing factor [Paraprevotella sp.]